MANGHTYLPGDFPAIQKTRNRSQTTVRLPPALVSPKKRASSFYPTGAQDTIEESNPDPFYLEHSLTSADSWPSARQDIGDAGSGGKIQQYLMLSLVNSDTQHQVPNAAARGRPQTNINRSTLSVVELEHQQNLQQLGSPPWGEKPNHYSQHSFGSMNSEATPDLTPSSSFSSNYSALYPDPVAKATEQLSILSKQANSSRIQQVYPSYSTPLNRSQASLSTLPSTPNREFKPQGVLGNDSSETLTMPQATGHDQASYRGKPLPSLPSLAVDGNGRSTRKGPPTRLVIEPSMISPPISYDPGTLEPHRSHFDQALFIPAYECPSPVPSPVAASPSIEQRATSVSTTKDRPSTSASEMYCEHSVWESDSDTETSDPRSLSRKPIAKLKKVRSRVQLRVAKSAPKLQPATQNQNSTVLEKFPTMPEPPPQGITPKSTKTALQARPGRDIFRPSAHQTLRIVAPSTSSLVRPQSRRGSSKSRSYDIDRSTAAALQAKFRRRQRSDCPELSLAAERGKICTFCREERSDIHHSLGLSRPPLYKRVWESLRVLSCHGDIPPPRSRKAK